MRILFVHHNANNLGDVAIVESTIAQMRKQFPGCELVLESNNPSLSRKQFSDIDIVPRLFAVSGIHHTSRIRSLGFVVKNLPFLARTAWAYATSWIFVNFKLSGLFFPIFKEYLKADLILSVAGDSISPDYAYFLRFYEISLIRRLKKPLILYAQSIGPFKPALVPNVKKYLSMVTAIFARDATTYELMRSYGVKTRIYRTADTVISLASKTNSVTEDVIRSFDLDGDTVAIVLRVLTYTNYSKEEYQQYLAGMNEVIVHIKKKGLKPILCASIPEDARAGDDFLRRFHLDAPMLHLFEYMPSEVKTILAPIKLIISPRMHPIILATTMGVPAIGLTREFKVKDYLGMVGLEDLVLDMIPFDYAKTVLMIDRIIDQRSFYVDKIRSCLPDLERLSLSNASCAQRIVDSSPGCNRPKDYSSSLGVVIQDERLVSIVIPTYNRLDKLRRLIECLFNSSYKNIEVLIVDDGSTDGTPAYLSLLASTNQNVRVFHNTTKRYAAGSRNVGLSHAQGEYIFLIDDDNVLDPKCIAELVSPMEMDDNLGMVGTVMYYYKEPGKIWWAGTERNMATSQTTYLFRDGNLPSSEMWPTVDFPNAWLLRRDIVDKGIQFDESLFIHYEESDFAYNTSLRLPYCFCVIKRAKIFHDVSDGAVDATRRWADYERVFYTARNRVIFHRRYSSLSDFVSFVLFWHWAFVLYYLKFIFSLPMSRRQKMMSVRSYLKGVLAGLVS